MPFLRPADSLTPGASGPRKQGGPVLQHLCDRLRGGVGGSGQGGRQILSLWTHRVGASCNDRGGGVVDPALQQGVGVSCPSQRPPRGLTSWDRPPGILQRLPERRNGSGLAPRQSARYIPQTVGDCDRRRGFVLFASYLDRHSFLLIVHGHQVSAVLRSRRMTWRTYKQA